MDKLLFIYLNESTFVKKDLDFLSQHFTVKKLQFYPSPKPFELFFRLIKQFVYLVFFVPRSKLIFCWFADYHSILPILFARIFNKRSIIVLGGYDVTGVKKINYGIHYANLFRRLANKWSLINANDLLPVHESLIENQNNYHCGESIHVGIFSVVQKIKGRVHPIPTGYDLEYWQAKSESNIRSGVLTVAGVSNEKTWLLKGGDMLLFLANSYPETAFHFYGLSDNMIDRLRCVGVPNNLYLHGYVNNEDLVTIYPKFKYYAQLSMSEGLPNSLCEAMLCGCIPIGSYVNGIPDAIGDTGYLLETQSEQEARRLFENILKNEDKSGEMARARIINNFGEEKRWKSFQNLLLT